MVDPNAIEIDATKPDILDLDLGPNDPMPDQTRSASGLLLEPGFRFNGTTISPLWNYPEENWCEWLTNAPLESIEDRVVMGADGVLWGTVLKPDFDIQSVLIKFPRVGNEKLLATFAAELCINQSVELINREMAAYEVAKGLGAEDLVCPVVTKELTTIGLLPDGMRDYIAQRLRINKVDVDKTLGHESTVQLVPRDMDNFIEVWGSYGVNNIERFRRASDEVRYSIYRAYFLDFILGVPIRSPAEYIYNRNTNRIMIPDLRWTFSHAGFTTEKYLQMRQKGWSRVTDEPKTYIENTPPSAYDFSTLFENIDNTYLEEMIETAGQITERLSDDIVKQMIMIMMEYDIPISCIASVLLRISYLSFSPGSVIKRPIEFIRNVCAPVRTEVVGEDARILKIINYVDGMMKNVLGAEFDTLAVLTESIPMITDFQA